MTRWLLVGGLVVCVVAEAALPASAPPLWRAVLLAALVVVPLLLSGAGNVRFALAALLAATLLAVSATLVPGTAAAILSVPWVVICGLLALDAIVRGVSGLPTILLPANAQVLGALVARGFLAVGAVFALADRAGVQPGGFSAQVVLLTAVHFHFAGFGLLTIGGRLASDHPRLRAAVYGLCIGVPITALGFILPSATASALGAVITATSALAIGIVLLVDRPSGLFPRIRRSMLALAGLALLISMPLAIAWSVSLALGGSFLDVDRMIATHGLLNATAVLLAAAALPFGSIAVVVSTDPGERVAAAP